MLCRRLVHGTLEMHVSKTAGATLCHYYLLAGGCDVGYEESGFCVRDKRAARHVHYKILASATETTATRASHAVFGVKARIEKKRNKGIDVRRAAYDHIAAAPAIATIRTAECDQCLAAERASPVTALAGADVNFNLIYERACFHAVRG